MTENDAPPTTTDAGADEVDIDQCQLSFSIVILLQSNNHTDKIKLTLLPSLVPRVQIRKNSFNNVDPYQPLKC